MSAGRASWPDAIIDEIRAQPPSGISVLADPDNLVDVPSDLGDVVTVPDRMALRAAYERYGRRRLPDAPRLVLHIVDPQVREARDLPWDIGQRSRVMVARFPGSRRWLDLYRELGDDERIRLTEMLARQGDPAPADVLRTVFGPTLPAPSEAAEFDAVARLRLAGAPASAWALARAFATGPIARALADDPPDLATVDAAWADWLARGRESPHHDTFHQSGPSLVALLTFGLLRPAPRAADGLPDWTTVGALERDPERTVEDLLDQRPALDATSLDEWAHVAAWWGSVRVAIAEASPARPRGLDEALATWDRTDEAFGPWLMRNLPVLRTSSRLAPTTVERIAPFLARRMRSGTKRICLIVMDGMGFAQWSLIRDALHLKVQEVHGVVAVAPTLTSYSRQAIFAGALPEMFPESLRDNTKEGARWAAFWKGEGLDRSAIHYANTPGASSSDVPDLGIADAIGIAVLAVDELTHGARLLGDAQVAAAVRDWLRHGFLSTLISSATERGFEVWITADHGNIEATAIDYLPMEGVAVDRTGERVRLYATETLRDAARAAGIAWQPPGLPTSGPFPVFAPGRHAYIRGTQPAVVHGGISIDEVIVPLARVSA